MYHDLPFNVGDLAQALHVELLQVLHVPMTRSPSLITIQKGSYHPCMMESLTLRMFQSALHIAKCTTSFRHSGSDPGIDNCILGYSAANVAELVHSFQ